MTAHYTKERANGAIDLLDDINELLSTSNKVDIPSLTDALARYRVQLQAAVKASNGADEVLLPTLMVFYYSVTIKKQ